MTAEPLLPITQDMQPKYSAFGQQLLRLELLLNACLNNYANLETTSGRSQFMKSIWAFYIALSPHLKNEDRTIVKTYIMKLGIMSRQLDNMSLEAMGNGLENFDKQTSSLLEIMNLLKDKRGLGIPRNKKLEWETEFGESLDIKEKEVEKDATEPNIKQSKGGE